MAMRRSQRAGVEDRWYTRKTFVDSDGKTKKVPSANHGCAKRWRARYVDDQGVEHVESFRIKPEAQAWLDKAVSTLLQGTHVAPKEQAVTVKQWAETWIEGCKIHRDGTVRSAKTHIGQINTEFGNLRLSAVRPSAVKAWCAKLKDAGHSDSYVYALHSRLTQILGDAVHDGLLARNPCSRRTSPPMGKQKVYLATTKQVWALHDALARHLAAAVLLGAFAGLRVAEVSALQVDDVDFMRGFVHPKRQWPEKPLKTRGSDAPIPVPRSLTLMLAAYRQEFGGSDYLVCDLLGDPVPPWQIERAIRDVRSGIDGLPAGFTFHDLRHYLASLLISQGADIKTVQARLRHASAKTTLDTYGHLWPDADESTRTMIDAVISERLETPADGLRTNGL